MWVALQIWLLWAALTCLLLQERNLLKRVHLETFGKSGCRRIVPGQMLAADPKGRACMIAAVEKQKVPLPCRLSGKR